MSGLTLYLVCFIVPLAFGLWAQMKVKRTFAKYSQVAPRNGMTGAQAAAEVLRYLDLVGLEPDHAARLPATLSGGQRQRVAIARALAAEPRVLLGDEITSALDVSVQAAILNLIRDLQRRLGFTLLFISHNIAAVRYLCDEIAVMEGGRLVEVGPADAVTRAPTHPYTRRLIDAVPRLAPPAGDGSLLEEGTTC